MALPDRVNINAVESALDNITLRVGLALVNDHKFYKWAMDELPIVRQRDNSFRYSLSRANIRDYYRRQLKGNHVDKWDQIELKLSIWLSNHYRDQIAEVKNETPL